MQHMVYFIYFLNIELIQSNLASQIVSRATNITTILSRGEFTPKENKNISSVSNYLS